MARDKTTENTETPVNIDAAADRIDEAADRMDIPADPVASKPVAQATTHTRDRNPADREAWKRQRAGALGIHRD